MKPNGGIRWDGTISLGSIVAGLIVVVPLIGGAYLTVNQVAGIQSTMDKQGEKFDSRLKSVEDRIGDIQLQIARSDGVRAKVEDLLAKDADKEMRLRKLEGRG